MVLLFSENSHRSREGLYLFHFEGTYLQKISIKPFSDPCEASLKLRIKLAQWLGDLNRRTKTFYNKIKLMDKIIFRKAAQLKISCF